MPDPVPNQVTKNPEIAVIANQWNDIFYRLNTATKDEVSEAVLFFQESSAKHNIPSLAFAAKRLQHIHENGITSINVGGTMGSGKSSIAEQLAKFLKFNLIDADEFHPDANIDKMSKNIPLTNEDRVPFLKAVFNHLSKQGTVSTCSALTGAYRAYLYGKDQSIITDPSASNPWEIENGNLGLLQITVYKPYEIHLLS